MLFVLIVSSRASAYPCMVNYTTLKAQSPALPAISFLEGNGNLNSLPHCLGTSWMVCLVYCTRTESSKRDGEGAASLARLPADHRYEPDAQRYFRWQHLHGDLNGAELFGRSQSSKSCHFIDIVHKWQLLYLASLVNCFWPVLCFKGKKSWKVGAQGATIRSRWG